MEKDKSKRSTQKGRGHKVTMAKCPCGSKNSYEKCCEPIINGMCPAETAEELLRSRYTAHVKENVDYIIKTVHPAKRKENDRKSIQEWSENTEWQKLEIIDVTKGGIDDSEGRIEFKAHFKGEKGNDIHHELSRFKKSGGQWFFFDGKTAPHKQVTRATPKIGRNDPCPCGSGKKYKKCCGK